MKKLWILSPGLLLTLQCTHHRSVRSSAGRSRDLRSLAPSRPAPGPPRLYRAAAPIPPGHVRPRPPRPPAAPPLPRGRPENPERGSAARPGRAAALGMLSSRGRFFGRK